MTYMFILKCALKLVLKNILDYDARSEKHQNKFVKLVHQDSLITKISVRSKFHGPKPFQTMRHVKLSSNTYFLI